MRLLKISAAVFAAAASLAGAQQASPPALPEPGGQVILSRSLDAAASASPAPAPAKRAAASPPPAGAVTDAERRGVTFLSYDFNVHLEPKQQAIAVRARMTLRNDGDRPLRRLPLQISSSLAWVDIRVEGRAAPFAQQKVDSDTDHTGALDEAVVVLPQPLAPKQSIQVDATYQGTVALSARRLQQIGAPEEVAERSDWDRVSDGFVGLRGFGNVVWYPVVSVPVMLGDGDKFFTEVAAQKLRQSGAMVSMRITEEFFGPAPNLAVLDGKLSAVTPTSLPVSATLPGIATCVLSKTRLGFSMPSLFLLTRVESADKGLRIFTRPEDAVNVQSYRTAAAMVAPLVKQWLGSQPRSALVIVDLPEPEDASFEEGPVLFTGIQAAAPEKLAGILVHSLTHAYFDSPYPWLQEGVAYFMGTLWVERNRGRKTAIAELDNTRGALSLAEPADPAAESTGSKPPGEAGEDSTDNAGESLTAARDAVYYRTKATYVFWMLRDLAGDDALAQAFRQYDPSGDTDGTEFERVLERSSGKDLKWFFSDWVYHDRGLPDLSIAGVYPNSASIPGSYIVAVDIANSGYAEAEVPVSVRSDVTTVTERLRIPANSRVTHRFLLAGQPREVAVNDGTVPEVQASVHRRSLIGASQPQEP